MSEQQRQAICCTCGSVRTCRRPRNYRPENYWLRGPVDRDWHRETGDLKCEECGRVTTHAIITGDDHAEKLREVATGWFYKSLTEADRQRIQRAWRQGDPRNPHAHHLWWWSDLEKAWDAGQSVFPAICKAELPVPEQQSERGRESNYRAYEIDELIAPKYCHDVDLEDPATGLWWYEVDCTDCLCRANMIALGEQRQALQAKLQKIVDKVSRLDARTVADLLDRFRDAESETK
ncbi:hypothetical protein FPV58_22050 [Mycolicibacterium porcinum]|uniref:hypothetical protein n=1 Tax=Mycolicibacterium porcinum TaxID=39693 RepID=UPI00119359F5|nr:hypothetical protein [Mycolicibacterium porcinum]TVX97859.1 hypothetical protein FPV58_22050 [Mycolicibacterium porcinum]